MQARHLRARKSRLQRRMKIGLRIALGAQSGDVRWMVLRDTVAVILAGIAVGVPAALAVTRLIAGLLFDLSGSDPSILALAAIMLLFIGILAGYLPARRATRVDPMVALRQY